MGWLYSNVRHFIPAWPHCTSELGNQGTNESHRLKEWANEKVFARLSNLSPEALYQEDPS